MQILGLIDIPNWILILSLFVIFTYIYDIYPYSYWKKRGVKQPPQVPFLGSMWGFINGKILQTMMSDNVKYGSVFGTYLLRRPILNVSDSDMIKKICIKHSDHFTDRTSFYQPRPMDRSILALKGAEWKNMRSLLSPAFSSGKLKAMYPLIEEASGELVKELAKHVGESEIAIKDHVTAFTMDVIASTMFGLKINTHGNPDNDFKRHSQGIFNFQGRALIKFLLLAAFPNIVTPIFRKFNISLIDQDHMDFFVDVVRDALYERKKSESMDQYKDFLSSMVAAMDSEDKKLTEDDILGQLLIFFLAGFETTANTMHYVLYFLAQNPDVDTKLLEEIRSADKLDYETVMGFKYLTQVIDESLRMIPPAVMTDRQCTGDISINGYDIEKGVSVRIPVYFLAHSPDLWENPETFNPDRFSPEEADRIDPMSFIPFGVGPRNCIGMRLAQMEIRKALSEMLLRFKFDPTESTPSFQNLQFKPASGILMPKTPIMLKISKRD